MSSVRAGFTLFIVGLFLGWSSLWGQSSENPFFAPQPDGELFSTEKPLALSRGDWSKPDRPFIGLTLNGLSGLVFTETTEKVQPRRMYFQTAYQYTPWQRRFDKEFSKAETGALQTYSASAMYASDNGELSVTLPYHYFDISAPRLFGQPAHENSGIGDVKLGGKLTWFPPKSYYQFAAGVIVDLPTGNARSLRPAGVTDHETVKLFGNVTTKETNDLRGHIQLGYIFKEDGFDVAFYHLAGDYAMTPSTTLIAEFIGSEGPAGYGSNLDFAPALRVKISETFKGTLGSAFTLYDGKEFGYDYKIHLQGQWIW